MSWVRVAVASSDGVDIDQTLSEASRFHIYDVGVGRFEPVEVREEKGSEEDPAGGTVDWLMDLVSDCTILLVRDLGIGAGGKLRIGWVTVYEAPMSVEKGLRKLAGSPLFRRAVEGSPTSPDS